MCAGWRYKCNGLGTVILFSGATGEKSFWLPDNLIHCLLCNLWNVLFETTVLCMQIYMPKIPGIPNDFQYYPNDFGLEYEVRTGNLEPHPQRSALMSAPTFVHATSWN